MINGDKFHKKEKQVLFIKTAYAGSCLEFVEGRNVLPANIDRGLRSLILTFV